MAKKLIEYRPQHFASTYEEYGREIWKFLQTRECVDRMKETAKEGRAAAADLAVPLLNRFGKNVRRYRVRQMIGHMIRQIMAHHGFALDKKRKAIRRGKLFTCGATYVSK